MFFDRIKHPRLRSIVGLALISGSVLGLNGSGSAQEPKAKGRRPNDPATRALLEEVSKAYRALSSYSDQGQFVVAITLGGKVQKQVRPLKLTFARPNRVRPRHRRGPAQ